VRLHIQKINLISSQKPEKLLQSILQMALVSNCIVGIFNDGKDILKQRSLDLSIFLRDIYEKIHF
jgi:hypothetical protein